MFVYNNEIFSYPDATIVTYTRSSIHNDHKNQVIIKNTIKNIKRRLSDFLSQFSFKKKDNCAH